MEYLNETNKYNFISPLKRQLQNIHYEKQIK